MSVLSPEIHAALTPLLQALSSPDNAVRTNAEAQLNSEWVAVRPDVLLMGLVEQIQDNRDPSVGDTLHAHCLRFDHISDERLTQTRTFAAVLFRRMATKNQKLPNSAEPRELFLSLSQPQKIAIRGKLLLCLQNEGISVVRHKVGDAVAEIARQYAEDGMLFIWWSRKRSDSRCEIQGSHGRNY